MNRPLIPHLAMPCERHSVKDDILFHVVWKFSLQSLAAGKAVVLSLLTWETLNKENGFYCSCKLNSPNGTDCPTLACTLTSPFPSSLPPLRSVRGVFWVDLELGGGQHLFAWHDGWSCVPGSLGQPIAQSYVDHNCIRYDKTKETIN